MKHLRLIVVVGAVLAASAVVWAQPALSLFNQRLTVDANGSLIVKTAAYGGSPGPATNAANLRVKADANNALIVAVGSGTMTPDTVCLDGTNQDACLARNAANVFGFRPTAAGTDTVLLNASTGLFTKVGTLTTAGKGVPIIVAYGRSTAQAGAVGSVATFTPSADGSFEISANVLVTVATTHSFTVVCAYTDEGNTARSATLIFALTGGSATGTIANANGAIPYMGQPAHIRVKGGTAITISTSGTFTTVTYNVEGVIKQVA